MTSGIVLYGRANSRASRCLWILEELQLKYEHVGIDPDKGESRTDEYVKINPTGQIPALRDGPLVLRESLAISLHLAMRYGRPLLWPEDPGRQARVLEGVFFAATGVEPPAAALLEESIMLPAGTEPDQRRVTRATTRAHRALETLERALYSSTWYAGDAFSVSDVALASVVKWLKGAKFDLAPFPAVSEWLTRSMGRPAYQRVLNIKQSKARR
jgi:glutathione S-transferase